MNVTRYAAMLSNFRTGLEKILLVLNKGALTSYLQIIIYLEEINMITSDNNVKNYYLNKILSNYIIEIKYCRIILLKLNTVEVYY